MTITTKILGIWFLPFGPSIVLSRKRIQEYSDFKRHFSFKPRHTYLKKEKRKKSQEALSSMLPIEFTDIYNYYDAYFDHSGQ